MTARLLACGLVLGFGLVSACGGAASESDLFGGSGGDNGSDASSANDASGNRDSGVVGQDATTGNDGSTQQDAAQQRDSTPPPVDSAPPVSLIKCEGTGGCHAGSQECCRTGTYPQFSYSCTAIGQCGGTNPLDIPCDKAANCSNGDICCVTADQQGIAADISCQPAQNCPPGNGKTWLCDPNASNACPPGTQLRCAPSTMTIPGYNICR